MGAVGRGVSHQGLVIVTLASLTSLALRLCVSIEDSCKKHFKMRLWH